jgi:hypothetical protein
MYIDDIATYLAAQSLGTVGTSIFKSYLPDLETDDTIITVLDTGGVTPDPYLPTKYPTFQIFVRAASYSAGRAKLDLVRAALHQQQNVELVTGQTYFYYILAQSEGGHIGRNEKGQDEFSMNFRCRTR